MSDFARDIEAPVNDLLSAVKVLVDRWDKSDSRLTDVTGYVGIRKSEIEHLYGIATELAALRQKAALLEMSRDAQALGLDYLPGELDRTAPERIWLQADTSANNGERDEAWLSAEGVSWHYEPIGGLEIQYVRADLAAPAAPAAVVDEEKLHEALAMMRQSESELRSDGVYRCCANTYAHCIAHVSAALSGKQGGGA